MKSLTSVTYKIFTALMIALLALTAMPVSPAYAAHTFGTTVRFTGNGNPLTQNFTIGATGTLLVVSIVTDGNTLRAGGAPTYNGIALTQADVNRISNNETVTELWYLLSPPTGANLISIPNTGNRNLFAIASSYSAQPGFTSALDVAAGAINTNANPTVALTTTAAGDTIVGAMGSGNTTPASADSGTTLFISDDGSFSDNGQYFLQPAAGLYTMTWTVGADDWGAVVAAFKEIPATTITLASDTNPSLTGQLVTFTATVTPAAAGGTVTFYDGATPIGNGPLAGGVATFSTNALVAASHNITAVYGGDATNGVSRSAVLVQVVNEAPVITSANTITFTLGQNNTFTATATGFPAPTWAIGGAALPSAVTFNAGTHVLSGIPASGTVGSYPVTFTATNISGTGTQNFNLVVQKGPQTINIPVNTPPTPAGFGTTYTVNPVSNNGAGQPTGLTVNVAASGACSNVGNVISYNTLGTCTILFTQGGDASYNAAPPVTRTVQVQPAGTTTTITSSVNPSVLGQNVVFTVHVTTAGAAIPTGTVTLTECSWATLPIIGSFCVGATNTIGTAPLVNGVAIFNISTLTIPLYNGIIIPHHIVATYTPTAGSPFNGSNEDLVQTVSTASTNVALTSSINPSFFGQSVTFTATVTVSPPGAGSVSGGTVTFYDGVTLLCTVANIPGNTATCTTSTLVRGTHNITAHYQGTDQYGTSTSAILPQIVRRDSDIALASSLNPSVYGDTVTFTATVIDSSVPPVLPATTPTGTVSFYDGAVLPANLLGTGALNAGGVATFNTSALIAGTHNITAVYNGDNFFVSSTSPVVVQIVTPAILRVTADNKSTIYGDNNVTFTVTYSDFVNGQTLATSDVTGTPSCTTTATTASPIGPYPITCTIGSLNSNNYTFNFVDGTLTVTQKPLTITADNQGKTYGFNLTFAGTEFTSVGLINTDTITSVTLTSAGAPAAAVNGSYPVVPSLAVGTGLGNYTITYVNGTLTVGGNLLIITANDFVGVNAKTYGNTLTFAGTEFTYFLAGGGVLQPGESLTSVTLSSLGTPANATVGTYAIVPSNAVGTGLNNYVIIYRNGQLDINQALLTFDPGSHTKVYGSIFAGYTGTFTGLMPFDTAVITPVYDSPGAPAAATVTAPGPVYPINVSFNDPNNRLSNYVLTLDPAPAATLTVLQRNLTVTPTDRNKIYGDVLTSADFAGTITGIQNGDNITATYDSPTGDPATAAIGTYPIVSTIADPNGMLGNYNVAAPDGTLTVTPRDLVITSNNQSKVYGEIFSAFTGSVVGLQNGDVVTPTYGSFGAPAAAAVGVYNITVLPLVGDTSNYNLIYNIGTLAVTRRDLVVTPNNITKIYGDTITFTAADGTVTGLQNGDAITPVYSSPGAIATATVAGSTYPITVTLNDPGGLLSNYNYTLNTGTLTVTLRDLTVTSDSKNKQYGTWFFAFTGSITGIQNGENITANYASAGSLPSAAVGPYPITVTPLNDPTGKLGNYNVILNEGTLTVGSSVLTVTADNKAISYGDPDPAFTFTYFGFAAGDTAAVVDTPPTCTVAVPHTDAGTYPIICSGGADNAYTFTYIQGTLTVNKRAIVVTPTNNTKVYGDIFTLFAGTVTGVQAGDNITATYASAGAIATAPIGPYAITATLNDPGNRLANNYTVTLNTGTLTVIPRALTVTPADKTKIYGDVFAAFSGTITGIQNGDAITATYASITGAPATATVAGSPYPITATLNAPAGVLANYTITTNTGNLAVTLRTLTVTPDNKAKVFGTVFNAFTGAVTGIQAGDNITVAYASTGSGAAAAVGSYPITAALTDPNNRLPNYTVVLNTGTLTVGVNVLTVTANNQTMVYGNADPAFTFTYAGFQPGDTPADLTTLPTCQVSVAHNAIGTYPITCSGGVDDNYIFSYVPATLTVTPRALTVTPDNKTKVYGDVFTAYTGTSTGIQAADNITITYASLGAAATAAVGPYQITATLNDPNNRLSNYTQTINTGTLTVTRRPLVVTPDDKNKVYGTVFTAYTGSVVGIQNGDTITPTYASAGAPAAAASGAYPITVTLNDPGNQLGNYNVTLNTGTLTVGGNTLVVTPADKTKIYGSTFAAFTGTVVGLQPGDIITATYNSGGAAANAIVGDYPITVTLNDPGNKLPNYTVILNTGTLSVTPRDLIVTPDNKGKAFGTNFNAFTGTLAGLQAGDIITPNYASTGAPAAAAVGIYPITVTLNDPGNKLPNYNVTLNTGTLSVGTNVLTVTANNQTMVYGNADPAFTFTYSGFLGADTPAVLDTPPTCQVSVTHNAVGTFPIACSGGIDNNYVFSYTPGTLTVTPRALTVTPANKTKVYGDTFTAFTGASVGLQAADNITVIYDSNGAPAVAAVGNHPITVTLNDPNNRLANYTVTLNTGTLAVTQRPLAVTPDNKNKVYGTLFTAFTGSVAGIQNGDAITPVYASAGAPAAAAGGTYPITVTLNGLPAVLANYAITLNTGTLTVGGNTLVVTPADKTKIYGSTFAAFTGTIVGLQPGDNITATYASAGAAANAIVGDYPITVTLNDPGNKLPNYTVTLNTGTLSVTPRTLLVVPDNKVKPSGTLFTAFTGTVTGVQAGDNITVTYASTGAPAAAGAGVYPITATLNDPNNRLPNYTVTISNTSTLTVSLTAQTITITTPAPVTAANGSTFTVAATASSGLPVAYSATGSCTNVGATFTMTSAIGACIVHYNQAGNGSYSPAQQEIEAVSAQLNTQTITVTTPAPAVAPVGSTFDVAATASSGLNVSITAAGVCTIVDHADGTATVTMVAANGTCEVRYNQGGNGTYAAAPQIIESVAVDSSSPTVTINQESVQVDPTNTSPINFTVVFSEPVTGFIDSDVVITGTAGATTATVTEIAPNNGTTYNVAVSGMVNDGTVIVSIPAAAAQDAAGNDNLKSTSADNTVTYLDGIGPNVQLVNTALDTGDGKLIDAEVVTVRVNQIMVKFNQDVFSVPNGDPNFGQSVINPNNYMLIRDLGDTAGLQTVSCNPGAVVPADTQIPVNSVVYDNTTYTATLSVNSLLALSNGSYHLFVCGTTSIVDPLDNNLKLVGNSGLPGTDFRRSFSVNITGNGGGGNNGGGNSGTRPAVVAAGLLIPVTGFNPNQVTILPKQPADKAYKSLDDIRIEIPTLGIDFPIVGVPEIDNGWNLAWLKNNVGYLEGSAYPTFNGNTVLTAHINDANKNVGPFSDIKGMQLGDKIFIHAYGKVYVYEVQENKKISPNDISTAFKHEEYAWITLVTCEDYNAKIEQYYHRRMVRAVLVSVVSEP